MMTLFKSATGAAHWPSILSAIGWFVGFMVSGILLYVSLVVNRNDRLAAYQKEQASLVENAEFRRNLTTEIPKSEEERLLELLRNCQRMKIGLLWAGQSDDARNYGRQLESIFKKAGFEVEVLTGMAMGTEGQIRIDARWTADPKLINEKLLVYDPTGPWGEVWKIIARNSNRNPTLEPGGSFPAEGLVRITVGSRR